MKLEDYFDFLGPDVIRFKGHRINLEHVVRYYLIKNGQHRRLLMHRWYSVCVCCVTKQHQKHEDQVSAGRESLTGHYGCCASP